MHCRYLRQFQTNAADGSITRHRSPRRPAGPSSVLTPPGTRNEGVSSSLALTATLTATAPDLDAPARLITRHLSHERTSTDSKVPVP